ncbi:TPA: hypothetical protein QHO11_005324 [Klebsiella oxytoca]|nr:hypothetical protein [Klebsiella oxytoca]
MIIYITNITLRKKLLRLPEIASARVILFKNRRKTEEIKRPVNISGYKSFPWCLTETVDKETLHKVLKWAANAPHARQTFSEQERLLFQYLGDGYNFQRLEKKMRLSRKYLYALKLSTLKKIGLTDGHPARILLCRDIINMSELSPEIYFNSSYRIF